MTRKRLVIIVTSILVVGGLLMAFSINGDKQLSKEAKRNREYEVSLVKALKNSYRDIEEIKISNPSYSNKPGNWSCTVYLLFSDGQSVEYGMSHRLTAVINKSVTDHPDKIRILEQYYGTTEGMILVTYSNNDKENE